MEKYQDLFEEAVERTRKHGLHPPDVSYDPALKITSEFREQFPYRAQEVIIGLRPQELLQCPLIHSLLLETIKDMLKTEVFFTLGWVWQEDDGKAATMSRIDDDWISEALKSGPATPPHAWLTLPSMEIIDLSIVSHLAITNKKPESMGGVLMCHPDEFSNNLHHVPMLVGDDFLRRTGMLREIMTLH